jgi:hypothetical protein
MRQLPANINRTSTTSSGRGTSGQIARAKSWLGERAGDGAPPAADRGSDAGVAGPAGGAQSGDGAGVLRGHGWQLLESWVASARPYLSARHWAAIVEFRAAYEAVA